MAAAPGDERGRLLDPGERTSARTAAPTISGRSFPHRSAALPRLILTADRWPLRRGLPPGVQRIGLLTEVPSLLRQLGARPAAVLRKVGLTADALADREAHIPYASAVALLAECARATRCQHFGLLAGSQWRLEHLGLPGEIARSSATVGQALEQFTTLHWMNTTGGVAFMS